ncbi:MAG: hypothetical protein ACKVU2_15470 [Saprospiraceae bacterium]
MPVQQEWLSTMGTNPINEERIAQLERDLQAAQGAAQKYKQDLEKLRLQYADDLYAERQIGKQLRTESHRILHDYERLRVQKGGFGLKMLLFSGFGGFLSGIILLGVYMVFLRPKAEHLSTFERFRDTNQFNYERAISQGRFGEVEQDLQQNLDLPENAVIRPQVDFMKKIVGAARRRCE